MTPRPRKARSGTLLNAMVLAAAFVLLLQSPALANGFKQWFIGLSLVMIALPVAALCALGVLIALIRRAFCERKALVVSLVFSAIASVPALWLLVEDLEFLPRQLRSHSTSGTQIVLLLLVVISLLLFAWCGPIIQYRRLR